MSEMMSFIDLLRIEVAKLQAAQPDHAGAIGRAHALIVDGYLVDKGDGTGKVLSSNHHAWYEVNGSCACEAAKHGERCKHRSAWLLYQRVQKQYEAQLPQPDPLPPADTTQAEEVPPTIPRQFITMIQGKPFVQYQGLLAMAHEKGIDEFSAQIEFQSETVVYASARVKFKDGTVFAEWADATPKNVNQKIAPHFPRMALTRAKARTLRDGLNIGLCSVEELD